MQSKISEWTKLRCIWLRNIPFLYDSLYEIQVPNNNLKTSPLKFCKNKKLRFENEYLRSSITEIPLDSAITSNIKCYSSNTETNQIKSQFMYCNKNSMDIYILEICWNKDEFDNENYNLNSNYNPNFNVMNIFDKNINKTNSEYYKDDLNESINLCQKDIIKNNKDMNCLPSNCIRLLNNNNTDQTIVAVSCIDGSIGYIYKENKDILLSENNLCNYIYNNINNHKDLAYGLSWNKFNPKILSSCSKSGELFISDIFYNKILFNDIINKDNDFDYLSLNDISWFNENLVCSISSKGILYNWDIRENPKNKTKFKISNYELISLDMHPIHPFFVIGDNIGIATLWDFRKFSSIKNSKHNSILTLDYLEKNRSLNSKTSKYSKLESTNNTNLNIYGSPITKISWMPYPGYSILCCAHHTGHLRIWDISNNPEFSVINSGLSYYQQSNNLVFVHSAHFINGFPPSNLDFSLINKNKKDNQEFKNFSELYIQNLYYNNNKKKELLNNIEKCSKSSDLQDMNTSKNFQVYKESHLIENFLFPIDYTYMIPLRDELYSTMIVSIDNSYTVNIWSPRHVGNFTVPEDVHQSDEKRRKTNFLELK
ncbi:hypothetical protein cand_028940 [Cryptosporidium andersoni]|uniref:WD repeat-containing protein n=1 Tax=Cryptosporidium andersoni TaxID=117008 RepID=A0A1J4MNU5_9CRYT|nr:hypothetical protein cand_028940 [Cryptosporidium andersoni]